MVTIYGVVVTKLVGFGSTPTRGKLLNDEYIICSVSGYSFFYVNILKYLNTFISSLVTVEQVLYSMEPELMCMKYLRLSKFIMKHVYIFFMYY